MKNQEPKHKATMYLPKGGKKAWTELMQGEAPVSEEIDVGSPLVMATASFDDGTWVAGGVYKSETPEEYNIIFMWVFDKNGVQYSGWPIDVSDYEDFYVNGILFSLHEEIEDEYLLEIVD